MPTCKSTSGIGGELAVYIIESGQPLLSLVR